MVISCLIGVIASPTQQDLTEEMAALWKQMDGAMHAMVQSSNMPSSSSGDIDVEAPPSSGEVETLSHEGLSASAQANSNIAAVQKSNLTFSIKQTMNETLLEKQLLVKRSIQSANQLRRGDEAVILLGKAALEQNTRFDSLPLLLEEVEKFGRERMGAGRERERFLAQWPLEGADGPHGGKEALGRELAEVAQQAKEWTEKLKKASGAAVGVQLLQLFVQDLLGRSSRKAKVIANLALDW